MNWIEWIVHTTTRGADDVAALLMEKGATGTQIEDRADIPDPSRPHGIWEIIDPALLENMPKDVLVHGWWEEGPDQEARKADLLSALSALQKDHPGFGTLQLEEKLLPGEDWGETWKQNYHPLRAGKHLIIRPSWETCEVLPGDHVIEMDPGMAFGSGYHDTTLLCLTLLEKHLRPGDTVLDVGTGSGILALGAAMSGSGRVLAVDIDPDAVRVARENVEHHGLSGQIEVREGDLLRQVNETFDLCVANIIADVVLTLAVPVQTRVRPGGLFICSGVILERAGEVRSFLLGAGYEPVEELKTEEWIAFCMRRPG